MNQTKVNAELKTARARENKYLTFARYVLVACLVVTGVALVLCLIWYAAELLLLVFAGLLVSILLRGVSRFVSQKTGFGRKLSLALVALAFLALIVAAGWLVAERISTQIAEIRQILPQAVGNIENYLGQYELTRHALANLPNLSDWLAERNSTIVARITGLASTALGGILDTVVIFVIGLYLAFQPGLYSRGGKHLLPFRFRARADEVLGVLDEALWRWLIGRFALMLANGLLTGIGLWILRVPLAFTLGLLAGLLNFIPNFGPWIAAIPAILIAFLQSPQQALYVALLYLVLQMLDGEVLTPLVDSKSVELPPVLNLLAQIFLGVAFGVLGLLLASPLTAVAMILIKMLYVEDVIGDPVMEDGNAKKNEPERRSSEESSDN